MRLSRSQHEPTRCWIILSDRHEVGWIPRVVPLMKERRGAFSTRSADPNLDRIEENESPNARATCPAREDHRLDTYTFAFTHNTLVRNVRIQRAHASPVCIAYTARNSRARTCERAVDLDAGGFLSRWDTAIKIHTPSEIRSLKSERDATTTTIYRVTGCPRSCDPITRRDFLACSRTASTLIVVGYRQFSCLHRMLNVRCVLCGSKLFWDSTDT